MVNVLSKYSNVKKSLSVRQDHKYTHTSPGKALKTEQLNLEIDAQIKMFTET